MGTIWNTNTNMGTKLGGGLGWVQVQFRASFASSPKRAISTRRVHVGAFCRRTKPTLCDSDNSLITASASKAAEPKSSRQSRSEKPRVLLRGKKQSLECAAEPESDKFARQFLQSSIDHDSLEIDTITDAWYDQGQCAYQSRRFNTRRVKPCTSCPFGKEGNLWSLSSRSLSSSAGPASSHPIAHQDTDILSNLVLVSASGSLEATSVTFRKEDQPRAESSFRGSHTHAVYDR
jgi:hypothetical protein